MENYIAKEEEYRQKADKNMPCTIFSAGQSDDISPENRFDYSGYDYDRLEVADRMEISHCIYLKEDKTDISALTSLSLEELVRRRKESATIEQAIFKALQEQATRWEKQAAKTLFFDRAIEYMKTPAVMHTGNQWETDESGTIHYISNRVYKMRYYICASSRYDGQTGKSVPDCWRLTWQVYTNGPDSSRQIQIAGQDRKTFKDRAAMEKYLNGRIKAYSHLFTELSPAVPAEYAGAFKVNGLLLPGYTVEEQEQPVQAE